MLGITAPIPQMTSIIPITKAQRARRLGLPGAHRFAMDLMLHPLSDAGRSLCSALLSSCVSATISSSLQSRTVYYPRMFGMPSRISSAPAYPFA